MAMLASPEGVRDYLAQKQRLVKAELQLRQSKSVVATAAAQTASDREVICFLDRRVRELELELDRACGTSAPVMTGTGTLPSPPVRSEGHRARAVTQQNG